MSSTGCYRAGFSVIVVLLGVIAIVVGVTIGLANDVLDSLDELQTAAPEAAAGLEERFDWAADIRVTDRVQSFVSELDDRIPRAAPCLVSQGPRADGLPRDRDSDAVLPGLRPALLRRLRQTVPRGPPGEHAYGRHGRRVARSPLPLDRPRPLTREWDRRRPALLGTRPAGGNQPWSRRRRIHDPSTDRRARRRRTRLAAAFGLEEGGQDSSSSPC